MDREKVIKGLELIIWEVDHNSMWLPGEDDIRDAIALLKEQEHKDKMFHALEDDWKRLKELLKEQETILEMACKVIGYSGLCNTELCTEHCDTNGKYKCVERWLEKEVSKGR